MTNCTLEVLPDTFAICRLDGSAGVPEWAKGKFTSVTRTPHELSIVCCQDDVPAEIQSEDGWRCLRAAGPLDFALVGVIASLTGALAAANISVFVISTFDTDYILVKDADLDGAVESLRASGHPVS